MEYSQFFSDPDNHCVRIDWKAETEDTLFCLQEKWGDKYSALHNAGFLSLAENYSAETTEDYLPAFGQELTLHNLALYNIIEDSDSYCLVIIPQEDTSVFEKCAKSKKVKVALQKQPRKKNGDPAQRLKLAHRLPYSQYVLDRGSDIKIVGNIAVNAVSHYINHGFSHETCSLFDLSVWPPEEYPYSEIITAMGYSEEYNVWAAIFKDKEKDTHLRISRTPFDEASWTEIAVPVDPSWAKLRNDPKEKYYVADVLYPLSKLEWIGSDLFITYVRDYQWGTLLKRSHVWMVSNAANGGDVCKKVFASKPLDSLPYPRVLKMSGGETLFFLSDGYYRWDGLEFLRTLEKNTLPNGDCVATKPTCFVYIDNGRLIEIDINTAKERSAVLARMDDKASIKPYTEDWVVINRWGYANKSLDIAQFWNFEDGAYLSMPFGSLGKHYVRDLFFHPDGYTIILSGENVFVKIENLITLLSSKKKSVQNLALSEVKNCRKINVKPNVLRKQQLK